MYIAARFTGITPEKQYYYMEIDMDLIMMQKNSTENDKLQKDRVMNLITIQQNSFAKTFKNKTIEWDLENVKLIFI